MLPRCCLHAWSRSSLASRGFRSAASLSPCHCAASLRGRHSAECNALPDGARRRSSTIDDAEGGEQHGGKQQRHGQESRGGSHGAPSLAHWRCARCCREEQWPGGGGHRGGGGRRGERIKGQHETPRKHCLHLHDTTQQTQQRSPSHACVFERADPLEMLAETIVQKNCSPLQQLLRATSSAEVLVRASHGPFSPQRLLIATDRKKEEI